MQLRAIRRRHDKVSVLDSVRGAGGWVEGGKRRGEEEGESAEGGAGSVLPDLAQPSLGIQGLILFYCLLLNYSPFFFYRNVMHSDVCVYSL